jgi:hypothetical protein
MDAHLQALVSLGMTPLEAAVYACLLERPSSTGYAVARAVGKPTANTYKALAGLEDRGAVTVTDEGKRLYRAVAPVELLDALERRFRANRDAAARGLSRLEVTRDDDGIHGLRTFEQVIARLRRMIARCRVSAVLDLAPVAASALTEDLAAAAATGADVRVKVAEPTEIDGVTCVAGSDRGADVTPVAAVTDGLEVLLATLDGASGQLRRAVWTRQPDLAAVVHRALVAELLFAEVDAGLSRGLSIDELEDTFATYARLRSSDSA